MKTRIILAIVLMVLLISCGQPTMEEAPKAEPQTSATPPPPEVEPPASSPYEHAENGQATG